MKIFRNSLIFLICLFCINSAITNAAKYAGEAFNLGGNARSLALGNAYSALAADPSAIYYNPAGLVKIPNRQVIFMHSETFGSLLNHDFLAYAQPARLKGKKSAVGIGIYRLAGGGILLTEWDAVKGRPVVISEKSHYDYLLQGGIGIYLSNNLRIGTAIRIILRSLGENSAYGLGIDFGAQYDVRKGIELSFVASNATSSFLSYDNGTKESILPSLKLGFNLYHDINQVQVRLVGDGDILFEGRKESAQFWSGEMSLDTHFGAEVAYYNLVFFRVGSDISRLTLGFGVKFDRFQFDGAFLDHQDLENSYRVSMIVDF